MSYGSGQRDVERDPRPESHPHAGSWLDGPATMDGEPFVMGDKWPWFAIVYFWLLVAAGLSVLGILVHARLAAIFG